MLKKIMDKAQQRKNTPVARGFLYYFADAIKAVAQLSLIANEQHNKGEHLHWAKEKSTDEADALLRHLIDAGENWDRIDDDGVLHATKVAWRGMALLQRVLDRNATHTFHAHNNGEDTCFKCEVEKHNV